VAHQLGKRDRLNPASDHPTREGVTHVMEGHALDPSACRCRLEPAAGDVPMTERRPFLRGEYGILIV
jgi:hypothetical protein